MKGDMKNLNSLQLIYKAANKHRYDVLKDRGLRWLRHVVNMNYGYLWLGLEIIFG